MRQVRPHSKSHTAQRLVMRKVSVTTVTTCNRSKERPYRLCTKNQLHTSTPQYHVLLYYKTVVSSETAYVQMYNSDVVYDKCELILSRYVAEAITT